MAWLFVIGHAAWKPWNTILTSDYQYFISLQMFLWCLRIKKLSTIDPKYWISGHEYTNKGLKYS